MKCECIQCPACNGTGDVWWSWNGRNLGNSRCDDFDELESCEECGGEGIIQMCWHCYIEDQEGRDE